ncbi:MAG TPA: ribonuclease R, partial [Sphingomicrobium sp.]|nr:ribonuclease R [Sphingomicrobium sp.]
MAPKQSSTLPSKKEILDFIAGSGQPAGKREIARAFGLKGSDKIALKKLLNEMGEEGLIESSKGRALHPAGTLPKVAVLKVSEGDEDGRIWAKPEQWEAQAPPPRVRVVEKGRKGALGLGDRVLARTEERDGGYVAHPLKKLARQAELVLGVLRKEGSRTWLTPVEKKERRELAVSDTKDGVAGDLVLCELTGRG